MTPIDKAKEICKKIHKSFPQVKIWIDLYNHDINELAILIDKEEIFESQEYADFIVNIMDEIEEYDICFSCRYALSKNAIEVY